MPRTTAYHEIWLDKKLVAGDAVKDFEPMYGPYYLPRKVCVCVWPNIIMSPETDIHPSSKLLWHAHLIMT